MPGVRPRVALTLSRISPLQRASHERYREALERAGADVCPLYPGDPIPGEMDALCLSGGGDIAADRYGATDLDCRDVDPARDALELEVARVALARDIPVLGICRGFQVLNVARGGTLLQDVAGHRPDEREGLVEHRLVTASAGTRLATACGTAPLTVNSRHHQAVTAATLGRGLMPTAFVDDLVEAFEATDRRWAVGVQWHPERTAEVSPAARRIFDALVLEATRQVSAAR